MFMKKSEFPKDKYTVSGYDRYHRELMECYIRQVDSSYIKGRLCMIKAGNVFKLIPKDNNLDDYENYRAIEDAMYDKKSDEVYVKAVLWDDYKKEVADKGYEFIEPKDEICR